MGGLGNQMFQYAAGRRLAVKRQTPLKLDLTWLKFIQNSDMLVLREFELDSFNFKASFATKKDLARIDIPPHTFKRRAYRTMAGPLKLYRENETADFYPEVLDAGKNSYLEGFWQSEKYFEDISEKIRDDFSFIKLARGENAKLVKSISNSESVSLHVRRGDYASSTTSLKMHGLISLDYYEAAINTVKKSIANPHFYVISDDPQWCKANIKIKDPVIFIDHNIKGIEDMRLMSLCNHNIIANSSFSWWGAWLNKHPDKIVCAPKKWFNNSKMSNINRLPESWIQL